MISRWRLRERERKEKKGDDVGKGNDIHRVTYQRGVGEKMFSDEEFHIVGHRLVIMDRIMRGIAMISKVLG